MAPKFYAVKVGRKPGIYHTWEQCEQQIYQFPSARHKSFPSMKAAQDYLAGVTDVVGAVAIAPTKLSGPVEETKGKKRDISEVEDTDGWDVVYCDGACKGNGKVGSVAGIGVWWGPNDPRNFGERCPGDQTNNRAELIAIARVLEETDSKPMRPLLIKTDSQYSINCLKTWHRKWSKMKWKTASGDPVKNKLVIQYILRRMEARPKTAPVELSYVKGHSGDPGNDGADYMANVGATHTPLPERDWSAELAKFNAKLSRDEQQALNSSVETSDSEGTNKIQKRRHGDVKTSIPEPFSRKLPSTSVRSPLPHTSSSNSGTSAQSILNNSSSQVDPSTGPPLIPESYPRKADTASSSASIPNPRPPGVAYFALPPLVPAQPTEIHYDDEELDAYAACLLDGDLADDLSDI